MERRYMEDETFNGSFPYKPRFMSLDGYRMHYVDEGTGEPIVCLHGMPTWGYLYRKFIKHLSKTHRVVVPDHVGFGKSDVPAGMEYVMEQHVDNFTSLMMELDLHDITLVVQDWGGPIGLGFAVEYPERISRLVIMNTSIGVARGGTKPWYQDLEDRGVYEAMFSNMKDTVPFLFKQSIHHQEVINDTMLQAYTAPFPNERYCIGALAFPRDIPIGFSHPSAPAMQHVRENMHLLHSKEKLLVWGMKDPVFPPSIIKRWTEKLLPGIQVKRINDASHFLQEDAPGDIIKMISTICSPSG
ncbi:alpha/beta fold hydrolase [Candidatus Bathyarchaeota archaeon]|nr:alpha/beta fold hydrolase [Candidatus Bathyarchaeota archaeon]